MTAELSTDELATIEFEAWPGSPNDLADAVNRKMNANRIALLLAIGVHHRTKTQLADSFANMGDTMMDLVDQITDAKKSLQEAIQVLDGAWARLIAAGSAVDVEMRRAAS